MSIEGGKEIKINQCVSTFIREIRVTNFTLYIIQYMHNFYKSQWAALNQNQFSENKVYFISCQNQPEFTHFEA